jgi:hypothetical protein
VQLPADGGIPGSFLEGFNVSRIISFMAELHFIAQNHLQL